MIYTENTSYSISSTQIALRRHWRGRGGLVYTIESFKSGEIYEFGPNHTIY